MKSSTIEFRSGHRFTEGLNLAEGAAPTTMFDDKVKPAQADICARCKKRRTFVDNQCTTCKRKIMTG